MALSSISTASLSTIMSSSVNSLQTQLSQAEIELSTGKNADIGLSLGSSIGQDLSLQNQQTLLTGMTASNNLIATRLDTTETTMGTIQSDAQTFLDQLVQNSGSDSTGSVLSQTATSNLKSMISNLNSAVSGNYLFSGTNTSTKPITDYFADSSANSQAVQSAITSAFGASPDYANISTTDMSSFLDSFDSLFTGSNWSSTWSAASDTTQTTTIGVGHTESTSVSANQQAFQQLAEAYSMVNALGNVGLSDATYKVVVAKAQSLVSSAVTNLTDLQASVGTVQAAITTSNSQMSAQLTILQTQVGNMESSDAYDASTRVSNLQTQIETAYSLTSQLKQLSLVNYL